MNDGRWADSFRQSKLVGRACSRLGERMKELYGELSSFRSKCGAEKVVTAWTWRNRNCWSVLVEIGEQSRTHKQSRRCEFGNPTPRSPCVIVAMVRPSNDRKKNMRRGEKYSEGEEDCLDDVGGVEEEVVAYSWGAGDICGGDVCRKHSHLDLERSDEVRVDGLGRKFLPGTGSYGCASSELVYGGDGLFEVWTLEWFA